MTVGYAGNTVLYVFGVNNSNIDLLLSSEGYKKEKKTSQVHFRI